MASGSFSSNSGTALNLLVEWNSQSNNDNYSNANVNVYLLYNALSCGARYDQVVLINEKEFKYNTSKITETDGYNQHKKLLASFSDVVYHDNDGNKKIIISASWKFNGKYSEKTIGTLNASEEITLDKIPRTSKINEFKDFNIGDNFYIDITKYSDNFIDTLNIKIDNNIIKTITGYNSKQVIAFSNDELSNIYKLMSTTNQKEFIAEIITKSDEKILGTTTKSANGNIINANPIFSESNISYYDSLETTKSITNDQTKIIQNQSNLIVYLNKATAQKGASISKYYVTVNGIKIEKTQPGQFNFGKVDSSKNIDIEVCVIDSRNNKTYSTKEITMIEWSKPTAQVTLKRLNNYEDETYLTINASYSSVLNKNSINIKYYKSTTEVFKREIKVGDDLSGATLYLDFPDRAIDFFGSLEFDDGNNNFITAAGGKLHAYANSSASNYVIDVRDANSYLIEELYRNVGGSSIDIDTNLKTFTLPSNFGKVISIDETYDFCKYIKIIESESSGSITNNTQATIICDKNCAWNFEIEITDLFSSVLYKGILNKGVFVFFTDVGLYSVGINQFPKYNKSLELTGDFYINDIIQNKSPMLPSGNLKSISFWKNIQQGKYFYNNSSGSSNAPSTTGFIDFFKYNNNFAVIWYSSVNNNTYRLYGDDNSISDWINI